jgi:hypothetical protein
VEANALERSGGARNYESHLAALWICTDNSVLRFKFI